MTPVELLSPAKNADYGKAAIIHGADAVYIGAPRFGARAEVSNTIADIEQLVRFAHLYRAKVYVTLNTILYDSEIDDAVRLMHLLYNAGIDALIIQDMGLLQCGLPPIPLFASTQTHNYSLDKISFLEKVGFQRVILARELSLPQISEIRSQTHIELESFVHGALCVSYSGQCYMSHAVAQRSGNRGICAQPCRSAYTLLDSEGKVLIDKAYLLSLRDLNLSSQLYALMQAGVTSFKIEGRLKDMNYLKNVTAFYRQRIDEILDGNKQWCKASSGKVTFHFMPDLSKTFNRGYTNYFIEGRKEKVASPLTQKSTGEELGVVVKIQPQWFEIETKTAICNGDGLCWFNQEKELEGVLVNRVEGNRIYPAKPVQIRTGMKIFRNNDFLFEKQLSGNSAERRIAISFELNECENGYILSARDEDDNCVEHFTETEKIPAKDIDKARSQIDTQLRKLGNTIFISHDVTIAPSFACFIPAAELNEMRRQVVQKLEDVRLNNYRIGTAERMSSEARFPVRELDYHGNIANRFAKDFYRQHGVEVMGDAFELQDNHREKILMTTKHCIKYQYNMCPKLQQPQQKWEEPLFIRNHHRTFRLEFDCRACEMKIIG